MVSLLLLHLSIHTRMTLSTRFKNITDMFDCLVLGDVANATIKQIKQPDPSKEAYVCDSVKCKGIKIPLIVQENLATISLTLFDHEAARIIGKTTQELNEKNKEPAEVEVSVDGRIGKDEHKVSLMVDIKEDAAKKSNPPINDSKRNICDVYDVYLPPTSDSKKLQKPKNSTDKPMALLILKLEK